VNKINLRIELPGYLILLTSLFLVL